MGQKIDFYKTLFHKLEMKVDKKAILKFKSQRNN